MKELQKELRKILPSTLMVIAMVVGLRFTIFASDMDTKANWYDGNQDAETFIVATEEDLKELSDLVNRTEKTFEGKTIILAKDIVLTSHFNPIGTPSYPFSGTFDGNDNTIYAKDGVYIGDPTESYQGLFGYVKNGTIKDLTVNATVVGENYIGAVVGHLAVTSDNKGTLEKCTNAGSVTGEGQCIGGVAGYIEIQSGGVTTVKNCSNTSDAIVTSTCTGEVNIGGLIGYISANGNSNVRVSESRNDGDLSTDCTSIGGLIGGVYRGNKNGVMEVASCYNTGDVKGSVLVGGLVGGNNGGTIKNCYNTGEISGNTMVGGLIGFNVGRSIPALVEACYNIGAVTGSEQTGAVIGVNGGGEVVNCYYDSEIVGETVTAGIGEDNNSQTVTPLTTLEMTGVGTDRADEKMVGFATSVWTFTEDGRGKHCYPVLTDYPQNPVPHVAYSEKTNSGTSTYYVKVTTNNGGSVSPDGGADHMQGVKKGDDIEFAIKANEGYRVADVLVNGKSFGTIQSCEFTNVHSHQTLEIVFTEDNKTTATFISEHEDGLEISDEEIVAIPFTDVEDTDPNFKGIAYVYENGVMAGVSSENFGKDMSITRGMIVTILHRISGSEPVDGDIPFIDVEASKYYTEAVRWGKTTGVVAGVSDVEFAPNVSITNEQFITFLYRYAVYAGMDLTVSEDVDLSEYHIRAYAHDAMYWAVSNGIIEKEDLKPRAMALRGNVATVLMHFIEIM